MLKSSKDFLCDLELNNSFEILRFFFQNYFLFYSFLLLALSYYFKVFKVFIENKIRNYLTKKVRFLDFFFILLDEFSNFHPN